MRGCGGLTWTRRKSCVDTYDSVIDESGMLPKTAAGAKVFGGGGGKLKALGPGRPVWKVGDFEVQRCVYVDPMMSQPMMIQLDPPKGCVDTLDSVTDESGMPLETAAGAKVLCLRSAGRISLQKPSGGLSVGESHRCSGSHSLEAIRVGRRNVGMQDHGYCRLYHGAGNSPPASSHEEGKEGCALNENCLLLAPHAHTLDQC